MERLIATRETDLFIIEIEDAGKLVTTTSSYPNLTTRPEMISLTGYSSNKTASYFPERSKEKLNTIDVAGCSASTIISNDEEEI